MIPGICDAPLIGTDTGSYAGGSLDTQTVFVGASGSAVQGNRIRGFIYASLGGISDGTSNIYSGTLIREIAAEEDQGLFDLVFTVTGTFANSGWNTINIDGSFGLARGGAIFSTGGGITTWRWINVGNAFGSIGQTRIVGFD